MYTKAAIISALLGLAAASPTASNLNNFEGVASHSGSAIQGAQIQANGGKFWLHKPTHTGCSKGIDCSKKTNQTVFTFVPNTGRLYMDVSTPGGQEVYVAKDGALSFAPAHSHYIPPGSALGPAQYKPQKSNGSVGSLLFQTKGFRACPRGNGVYQVYANSVNAQVHAESAEAEDVEDSNACIGMGFATVAKPAGVIPADQYI